MPIPSSGPVSLDDIAAEFGGTVPHALSEYAGQGNAPASGPIDLAADFYGTSSQFAFSFNPGTNLNLYNLAIAAGWDGAAALEATANAGTIQASSTGNYALTINGSYPGGLSFINNATIQGRGGNGGPGAVSNGPTSVAGPPGAAGGPGLLVSSPVTITNNGRIAGGGGGGGGGSGQSRNAPRQGARRAGGGGGGGGRGVASGGPGGAASGGAQNVPGQPGTAGTLSAAGTGGAGGSVASPGVPGGPGGPGGNWGSAGSNATGPAPAGSGGAAGTSIQGYSLITFVGPVGNLNGPTAG